MSGGVDLDRLKKLMRMTESSADGEALNALRLANKMLSAAGKHWGDIIGAKREDKSHLVPPSKRGFNSKPSGAAYGKRATQSKYDGSKGRHSDPQIDEWLDGLRRTALSIEFRMFIASVTEFWEKHGYLTDNQYAAVQRAHETSQLGRVRR